MKYFYIAGLLLFFIPQLVVAQGKNQVSTCDTSVVSDYARFDLVNNSQPGSLFPASEKLAANSHFENEFIQTIATDKKSHLLGGDGKDEYNKFNIVVGAAINISKISPSSSSPFYQSGGSAYTSYLPALSAGIEFPSNPETKRLIFRGEVGVAFSQFRSSYQNQTSPYVGVRSSFNEIGISITPQIIYNFYNAENFKFYGGIGIAVEYTKYNNVYFGSQDPSKPITDVSANNPYMFNDYDTPLVLKAGIQLYKNWSFFFNYFTVTDVTSRGYFQLNKNNRQFGLNYIFGK